MFILHHLDANNDIIVKLYLTTCILSGWERALAVLAPKLNTNIVIISECITYARHYTHTHTHTHLLNREQY